MVPSAPLTKEQLLDLWRRIMPPEYSIPIEEEAGGQGFDIPAAFAAIFAAASEGAGQSMQALYLRAHALQTRPPSSGAVKATGTVEIARRYSTAGAITLGAGTRLRAEQPGTRGQVVGLPVFELVDDLTLADGVAGPVVANVRAVFEGTTGNVPAFSIVGFEPVGRASVQCTIDSTLQLGRVDDGTEPNPDRFTQAMIGRYVTIVGATSGVYVPRKIVALTTFGVQVDLAMPFGDVGDTVTVEVVEYEDLGLMVTQPAATSGGLFGTLDAIGADRAIGRKLAESDEPYRARVAMLADVVSPAAIRRIVGSILDPLGVPWRLLETRDVETLKGFVWDQDPYDWGSLAPINGPTSEIVGQGVVWLNSQHMKRYFVILVGGGSAGEYGFAYDATTGLPEGLNAYDVGGAYDGSPLGYLSALGQVYSAVEQARAGGVAWTLERDFTLTP